MSEPRRPTRRPPPRGGRPSRATRRPPPPPRKRPQGEDLAHYRDTSSDAPPRATAAPGPDPFLGRTVGPCRVEEFLGEGGAGRVYRAHHERLDFEVALKVIAPGFHRRQEALERFQREARVSARLNHPNIARVYDVDTAEGNHYIIQELVRGESLEARVRRRGPLDEVEALEIAGDLASGLSSIHEAGIVHRDLKPGNVILTGGGTPKLIDFGIAKDTGVESGTHQDVVLGSPRFMAPEQAGARSKVGPPADVYGLGATLFFALTGQAPYEPEAEETLLQFFNRRLNSAMPSPRALRPSLNAELSALVERLLASEPVARPRAGEVHREITELLPRLRAARSQPTGLGSGSFPAVTEEGATAGTLEGMPLVEILQGIEFNEKSGELELQGEVGAEHVTGRITFKAGAPHEASTSDGLRGEKAVHRLLELEKGSFLLRKDVQLSGGGQIPISFTRLVLDFSRRSDESDRLPISLAEPPRAPEAEEPEAPAAGPPTGKQRLLRSQTFRLERTGKQPRHRSSDELAAGQALLEARAWSPGAGDPFLGCSMGAFKVEKLVEVERGERRYLATHTETDRPALLRVFPFVVENPWRQEFRRISDRAAAVLTVQHPCLEPCLGAGHSRDAFYAGFQPPVGRPWRELVAERGEGDPLPPEEVMRVVGAAALALQALHSRNLAHGDVSLDTIRVHGDPAAPEVVLTGAGLARTSASHAFLAAEHDVPGAPGHVAPEVLDRGQPSPAADLYALGVAAWTALVGRHPFAADDPIAQLRAQAAGELPPPVRQDGQAIPPDVATLVAKLAGRNPRQRYPDANEFLTDLGSYERGKPVHPFAAPTASAPTPTPSSGAWRVGAWRLALVALLALAAGAGALAARARTQAAAVQLSDPLTLFRFALPVGPAAPPAGD